MSKIDWVNIFTLNEVNQYCNSNELIQLSMVCKVIRTSLRNTRLNIFNFTSFTDSHEYKSCYIENFEDDMENEVFCIINPYKPMNDDLLESQSQFKYDLDLYRYNIDKLNLSYAYGEWYLIYEIPNVFQNLRSLVIDHTHIMLDTIQYLTDNLVYLEDLGLSNSVLYKRLNGSSNINWPISLKKLNLDSVALGHIEERDNDAILRSNIVPDEEYAELELSPKFLPSLLYLHHRPYYYKDNGYDLLQFLKLNPSIKYLYISDYSFDPEIFNLVKSSKNLIKLEYSYYPYRTIINNSLISSPVDSNIKNLSIHLPSNTGFLNMLTEQLPNLTDLSITNSIFEFNQLWPIISKFKKLKNLKLERYVYNIESKELNSQKFYNLESIELQCDNNVNFEVLNIDTSSFPKLKLIKFTLDYYCLPSYNMPELSKEAKSNWKLVYFPRKLLFYKVNQQNTLYYSKILSKGIYLASIVIFIYCLYLLHIRNKLY